MPTQLITFTTPRFTNKVIKADIDFQDSLEKIDRLAEENNLIIFVTSSARASSDPITGAIVRPASRSNHLIGHAIDMNIQLDGGFFNSKALSRKNFSKLPKPIQTFLDRIESDPILRWGGKFTEEDPVHIDDGLNITNATLWDEKFPIIQAQLRGDTGGSPELRELSLTNPRMKGKDVEAVQTALKNKFGFSDLVVDGDFGENTRDAVIAFQSARGLRADGIVGAQTREKLGI
jgi:hypothetical protein